MITEDKELGVYDRRLNVDPDVVINVYDVIETFGGLNAAAQHGLKKLLVTGGRSGEKSKRQDYVDVIESVKEAMRLDGLEPYETFRSTAELNSLVDYHIKRAKIFEDLTVDLEAIQGAMKKDLEDKDRHIAELNSLVDFHARQADILRQALFVEVSHLAGNRVGDMGAISAVIGRCKGTVAKLTEEHNNASND